MYSYSKGRPRQYLEQLEQLWRLSTEGRAVWQDPESGKRGLPCSGGEPRVFLGTSALLLWEGARNLPDCQWVCLGAPADRGKVGSVRVVIETRVDAGPRFWSYEAIVDNLHRRPVPGIDLGKGEIDFRTRKCSESFAALGHLRSEQEEQFFVDVLLSIAAGALIKRNRVGQKRYSISFERYLSILTSVDLVAEEVLFTSRYSLRMSSLTNRVAANPCPGTSALSHHWPTTTTYVRRLSNLVNMLKLTRVAWSAEEDAFLLGQWAAEQADMLNVSCWSDLSCPAIISKLWGKLLAQHKKHSWAHLWSNLMSRDLMSQRSWVPSMLFPRLRSACKAHAELPLKIGDVPLKWIEMRQCIDALGKRGVIEEQEWLRKSLIAARFSESELATKTKDELLDQLRLAISKSSYTSRPLRKRGGGLRWLDIPDATLKCQQSLLARVLNLISPRSNVSMAFQCHRSVVTHALPHARAKTLVTVDIRDFFGSVRPHHVRWWLDKLVTEGNWSKESVELILAIAFKSSKFGSLYLPQGAPSSPVLANIAAYMLDRYIERECKHAYHDRRVVYTRYADDLVLSIDGVENAVDSNFIKWSIDLLSAAVARFGWRLNSAKQRTWTPTDGPLVICGVPLSAENNARPKLSRAELRNVRNARHRARLCLGNVLDPACRGTLSHNYFRTGDPRWLAWISSSLLNFAQHLSGSELQQQFRDGWDSMLEATLGGGA
jgi:hypothetical protein